MRFQISVGKFNRVDVRCLVPSHFPEDLMQNTGFIGLEYLLGEEVLDRWTGYFDYEAVSEMPSDALAVEEVLEGVRALIIKIVSALPAYTWMKLREEAIWSTCKLDPVAAEDYACRDDQRTAMTCYTDWHLCVLNKRPAYSERFSRMGEIFGYVKIDGKDGLPPWGFADREEIENALQNALEAAGLGTVIGGGHGLRYSYVDLALLDVMQAVPIIREALARGGVSVRSWLLFPDQDLSAEWVGIYPETPPPPTETIPFPTP